MSLLAAQPSNLYPPLAPTTDTCNASVGIHFPLCYILKNTEKSWKTANEALAKAFLSRRGQLCHNCKSPWEAEQHSGKVWGDGGVLCTPMWIASESDSVFPIDGKFRLFFSFAFMLSQLIASLSYLISCSHLVVRVAVTTATLLLFYRFYCSFSLLHSISSKVVFVLPLCLSQMISFYIFVIFFHISNIS